MKVALHNNLDFLAGLLMLAIGGVGMYMALDYPFGSALRMGPGYFPRVLSGILMAFGLYVAIRGLRTGVKVEGVWGWKPLAFITASLWIFGWLMDKIGMVPSLVVLFFISALAGHEFKFKEVAILSVVLVIFSVVVFVKGLTLPFPICPAFIDNCPIR